MQYLLSPQIYGAFSGGFVCGLFSHFIHDVLNIHHQLEMPNSLLLIGIDPINKAPSDDMFDDMKDDIRDDMHDDTNDDVNDLHGKIEDMNAIIW